MASKNKKGLGRGINALFADFDEEKKQMKRLKNFNLTRSARTLINHGKTLMKKI